MNKKKIFSIILVSALLVCLFTVSAFATSDSYSSLSDAFFGNMPVIIIVAVIGGIITVIISYKSAKKKITTAVHQEQAADYVVRDSFRITKANDIYLYTTTTRTPRNTNKK
jgi:H+/gluconate symporter-like permease